MRHNSSKLASVGIGAMLLVTACGGGAAPASSAPASPPPASSAAAKPGGSAAATGAAKLTDGKVVIGVINDMTMIYADLGGKNSVAAAQMAADDWEAKNGKGSIGGPIEIVSADHQNKPDVATNKASEFYDRNGVDMITDTPTSSTALAIADVAGRSTSCTSQPVQPAAS
ncbi:MAG TPA: ABC transporter substrate-binding protein, partial [Chloroflexota bacterium]